MLKKFLLTVLLLLAAVPNGSAFAENWINIYNGDQKFYVETDSFEYDKGHRMVKCWNKLVFGDNEAVGYLYVDLDGRSTAYKSYILYENGKCVSNETVPDALLEYTPVIPDTVGSVTYKVLSGIAKLEDLVADWEFYTNSIPKAPSVDSKVWFKIAEDMDSYVDLSSRWEDGKYIYEWQKYVGDEIVSLQYLARDEKTGKVAAMKQMHYDRNNVKFLDAVMPVLIWVGDDGISPELSNTIYQIAIMGQ